MREFTGSLETEISFGQREELVVRLKEGDEQAFAEAFQLYKNLVHTLSCKLLADRAEAMDVTQEVFLTLFKKIDRFRGDCSLKTWLYRITLNQVANRNRWWKRRFKHRTTSIGLGLGPNGDQGFDPIDSDPSPEKWAESSELSRALQKGLEKLPFAQRTAVVLRDVQGLHYEEIGEITGAELGTVKSRIARGRERLRHYLQEFKPGRPE